MRWSLLMLFVSVLSVEGLYGEELPCQASKPTASKCDENKSICYCPLFPMAPNHWYGEFHPCDSACLTPEVVYFDEEQETQLCLVSGCECSPTLTSPACPTDPILDEPVKCDHFPSACTDDEVMDFPNEHARNCEFSDPRFISFIYGKDIIHAKLFAVTVDVQKRTGRSGARYRKDRYQAFLGFECKEPTEFTTKKDGFKIVEYCKGHVKLDLGLHQGIVLLANNR